MVCQEHTFLAYVTISYSLNEIVQDLECEGFENSCHLTDLMLVAITRAIGQRKEVEDHFREFPRLVVAGHFLTSSD